LTKAVWDEGHFVEDSIPNIDSIPLPSTPTLLDESVLATSKGIKSAALPNTQQYTITGYQQIDQSIPPSVYSLDSTQPIDLVWELMRQEAHIEAAREPLLVSFLYSTILNHPTLESALSFHLANRLSSPTMLSTQIMALIREASDADPDFRRNLRADILAVRDRDPACTCLPDVFLYFKGFHALQTYRVAHYLWKSGRRVLAHYLQSQVSQHFQIDIRECNLGPTTLTIINR
jgi:serine O-acetyltransferase